MNRAAIFSVIAALSVASAVPTPAEATVLRLLGVSEAIDDAASRISSILASIDRMAHGLIGEASKEAEARIDQAGAIVDDAVTRIAALPAEAEASALRILAETEASLLSFEERLFADVKATIAEVECAAVRTADSGQDFLGGFGDILGTGQIKIKPFLPVEVSWLCEKSPFCSGDPTFEIYANFEATSKEINRYMLEALAGMDDDDPATAIPETYRYLAHLARRTSCHTGGSPDDPWVRDHIAYTDAAMNWERYVSPDRGIR